MYFTNEDYSFIFIDEDFQFCLMITCQNPLFILAFLLNFLFLYFSNPLQLTVKYNCFF